MYKVHICNNGKDYEIKVYDYELNKWAISQCGTLFRNFTDALIIKKKITELGNSNICNVYITSIFH